MHEDIRILYAEKSLIIAPTELTYLPSPSIREYDYYVIASFRIGRRRVQLPLLLESVSAIHEFGRKAALDRSIPVSHIMLAFSSDRLLDLLDKDRLLSRLRGEGRVLTPISWVAPYIFILAGLEEEDINRELETLSDVSMLFRFFAYNAWLKLNEAMQVFSPFTYISRIIEPIYAELTVVKDDADLRQEFSDEASQLILDASLELLKWRVESELLAMRGCSKQSPVEERIRSLAEKLRCRFGRHKNTIRSFSRLYAEHIARIFVGGDNDNNYIVFIVFIPQLSHVIYSLRTLGLIEDRSGRISVKLLHPHLLNPLTPVIYVLEQLAKVSANEIKKRRIAILVVYDYPPHEDARALSDAIVEQLSRFIQAYLYCYSRRRLNLPCKCDKPYVYTVALTSAKHGVNATGYTIPCGSGNFLAATVRVEGGISQLDFLEFINGLPAILGARENINAVIATSYVDIPKKLLYSILSAAATLRQRTVGRRIQHIHVKRLVHLQAWEQVPYAGNLLGLAPPGARDGTGVPADNIVTGAPIYIYRVECDDCPYYRFNPFRETCDYEIHNLYRLLFGRYYDITRDLFTFDNLDIITDRIYIPIVEY